MKKYLFKLYITGQSTHSQQAIVNLQRLCREALQEDYELSVIDVLDDPEKAEADRILATPTLIRWHPQPVRRVIGDLSDIQKVMTALGL